MYYNHDFNSHLIIALNAQGKIKSLSYSFCKPSTSRVQECMVSFHFAESSLKVSMVFNSSNVYLHDDVEITQELYDAFSQKVTNIYQHSNSGGMRYNPKILLNALYNCVEDCGNKIGASNTGWVIENFSVLIQSLSNQFDEEFNRLNAEIETHSSLSMPSPTV